MQEMMTRNRTQASDGRPGCHDRSYTFMPQDSSALNGGDVALEDVQIRSEMVVVSTPDDGIGRVLDGGIRNFGLRFSSRDRQKPVLSLSLPF